MKLCMIFSKDHTNLNMTFLHYVLQNIMYIGYRIWWKFYEAYLCNIAYIYVIDKLFSQYITGPRSREEMKHNTFHIFIFDYRCLCLWLWRFSTTALVLWKQDFCVGEANWKIKIHKILFYWWKWQRLSFCIFPFLGIPCTCISCHLN